jgi:hypothetical protein
MSNAPRAWTTITGQTPASAAVAIQGQETLRTVYFDPAFARVEIDTSVNPPRAKITSGLTQLTADVVQLQLDVNSINTSIGVLESAVNAKVAAVNGDAPIVVNNTDPTNPTVTIDAATALAAGSMSATDFAKLASITVANIPSADEKAAIVGTSGTPVSVSNKLVDNADTRLVDHFPIQWSFSIGVTGSNPATIHSVPACATMLTSTGTAIVGRQPAMVNCQLMGFVLAANQDRVPTSGTLTFTVYKNNVATVDTFELNNNTTGSVLISTITGGGAFTTTYTAGTDDISLKVNVKTGSNITIAATNWCFVARMKAT